jgi:hypothetical protein
VPLLGAPGHDGRCFLHESPHIDVGAEQDVEWIVVGVGCSGRRSPVALYPA